jgi:hypothetical protein
MSITTYLMAARLNVSSLPNGLTEFYVELSAQLAYANASSNGSHCRGND